MRVFEFFWHTRGPTEITMDNTIKWIATVEPGDYSFQVRADNGNEDAHAPNHGFTVTVIAPDSITLAKNSKRS